MTAPTVSSPIAGTADDIARRCLIAHAAVGAVIAVVVIVVGVLAGLGIWALPIGVVVGGLISGWLASSVDARALKALGATEIPDGAHPQLENLVEGLVVANGFRMPTLYLVEDAAPNACAVGRNPRHAGLVVTSGLLTSLRRIELEGVIAHELTLIAGRRTQAALTAGSLICGPLGFAPELAARLAAMLVQPTAGLEADLAGAALTRYPPGLAAAFATMAADGRVVARNPSTWRHLWINVPPGALVRQQFTLSERIDVLAEL